MILLEKSKADRLDNICEILGIDIAERGNVLDIILMRVERMLENNEVLKSGELKLSVSVYLND